MILPVASDRGYTLCWGLQVEGAAEEVREREMAAAKKEAEVAAALEEVAQRETAAQAAAAQLARLDKQLGARKLEARELQVALQIDFLAPD